jgi:hypothetical protein
VEESGLVMGKNAFGVVAVLLQQFFVGFKIRTRRAVGDTGV